MTEKLVFEARDARGKHGLWGSDGTTAGTQEVDVPAAGSGLSHGGNTCGACDGTSITLLGIAHLQSSATV